MAAFSIREQEVRAGGLFLHFSGRDNVCALVIHSPAGIMRLTFNRDGEVLTITPELSERQKELIAKRAAELKTPVDSSGRTREVPPAPG